MLTLHGFDASNYVNMVKFALREKGLEFEQATLYPSQEDAVLSVSPMGKVPVLEDGELMLLSLRLSAVISPSSMALGNCCLKALPHKPPRPGSLNCFKTI